MRKRKPTLSEAKSSGSASGLVSSLYLRGLSLTATQLLKQDKILKRRTKATLAASRFLKLYERSVKGRKSSSTSGEAWKRAVVVADKLTRAARGRECQVRLSGICNFNPETTVIGHARIIGLSGIGYKLDSALGAHICSSCHSAADADDRHELDFLRGVLRTQALLLKEGLIQW